MAEIRRDPATGDWSIVASARAARPTDSRGGGRCPFCPGSEQMTPPEVLRVPGTGPWRIRVFPNLYPIVTPESGTGRHEVLVESPRHDWDLRRASPAEVAGILSAARERCRALTDAAAVVVFRNHGRPAGTSLLHPHSQLVALNRVPPRLAARWRRARAHHARTGQRLHDDLAAAARARAARVDAARADAGPADGSRLIADVGGVAVFAPSAAAFPYETVVQPADSADLATASDDALHAVATVLPRLLAALDTVLDDPPYNLVVHAGPPAAASWYRWHLGLYPRLTTPAGLELATGLSVNPVPPEESAAALRKAFAAPPP